MHIGERFLHNHPMTEKRLGLDENHVIVDRDAWDFVREHHLSNISNEDAYDIDGTELTIPEQAQLRMLFSTGKIKIKHVLSKTSTDEVVICDCCKKNPARICAECVN